MYAGAWKDGKHIKIRGRWAAPRAEVSRRPGREGALSPAQPLTPAFQSHYSLGMETLREIKLSRLAWKRLKQITAVHDALFFLCPSKRIKWVVVYLWGPAA